MKNVTKSTLIVHQTPTGSLGGDFPRKRKSCIPDEPLASGAGEHLYYGIDTNTNLFEETPQTTDEKIWNLLNDKLSAKANSENTCNSILEVTETTFSYSCIYPMTGVQMTYRVPYTYNEATFELLILWGQLVTQQDEFNEGAMMYK